MTKLVKKSVDVDKVLAKPQQSWAERLISWGLSKPAIATIFVAITGWIGRAFAEEENANAWTISMGQKVEDPFQYSRKMIFILGGFLIIISAILALFKKVSWFCLFSLLSWLTSIALCGLVVDFLTVDNYGVYDLNNIGLPSVVNDNDAAGMPLEITLALVLAIVFGLFIFLLPLLTTFVQYKRKKIDKKLLKHRLLIWLVCDLLIGGICLFLYLLDDLT